MSIKSPKPNSRKEIRKSRQSTLIPNENEPSQTFDQTSTQTQVQNESINNYLDNESIRALAINKEYLKSLGQEQYVPETSKSKEYPLKRVFVRKLKPLSEISESSASRSVKVAMPAPSQIAPSFTVTTLGQAPDLQSFQPGPKFSKDGSFIEHSILGKCLNVENNLIKDLP